MISSVVMDRRWILGRILRILSRQAPSRPVRRVDIVKERSWGPRRSSSGFINDVYRFIDRCWGHMLRVVRDGGNLEKKGKSPGG